MLRNFFISCLIIVWACQTSLFAQEKQKTRYRQKRDSILRRDPKLRRVPKIPPKGERIRVIFDTDARNEIDDVWAIALAILSPERFKIEGFVAANFDNSRPETGPDSIEASFKEIKIILDKAGLAGNGLFFAVLIPCDTNMNHQNLRAWILLSKKQWNQHLMILFG